MSPPLNISPRDKRILSKAQKTLIELRYWLLEDRDAYFDTGDLIYIEDAINRMEQLAGYHEDRDPGDETT